MKPLRIPGGNLDSIGLRRPAESSAPVVVQEAAKPEPAPAPRPEPLQVMVPMDGGIAEAIDALRQQLADMPARPRPIGIDAVITDRDERGMMKTVSMTFRWA